MHIYNFLTIEEKYRLNPHLSGDKEVDTFLSYSNMREVVKKEQGIIKYNCAKEDADYLRSALNVWENVINVKFIYDQCTPHLIFHYGYTVNRLVLRNEDNFSHQGADIFFTSFIKHTPKTFIEILHLIGEAIGLKHSYQGLNPLGEENPSKVLTVSSYDTFNIKGVKENQFIHFERNNYNGLQYLDIKAAQYLYGANHNYNNDDTLYSFKGEKKIICLWDGGGIDTINSDGYKNDVKINLQEGINYSSIIGETIIWIADGAKIENVVTGEGNDTIYCNELNGSINPGKGRNVIYNNVKGNKTFIFSGGFDIISGFKINDKLALPYSLVPSKDLLFNIIKDSFSNYDSPTNNMLFNFGENGSVELLFSGELNSNNFGYEHIELY